MRRKAWKYIDSCLANISIRILQTFHNASLNIAMQFRYNHGWGHWMRTEGNHIQCAARLESTFLAVLRMFQPECFRHSIMSGMALWISPCNSATIVVEDIKWEQKVTHTMCCKAWKYIDGCLANVSIWILQTFLNAGNCSLNITTQFHYSHGWGHWMGTEGNHIQCAARLESTLMAARQTYQFESFRHFTMPGMALWKSPRNSATTMVEDIEWEHIQCDARLESPLMAASRMFQSECFRHSTMSGIALWISPSNSATNHGWGHQMGTEGNTYNVPQGLKVHWWLPGKLTHPNASDIP